jgi:transposase
LAVRWNYHGFDVAQRQEAAMSLYAAIDLHSSNSVLAVMDGEGKALLQCRRPNDLPRLLSDLAPYRNELVGVAVESTYNWYWLVDGLKDHGYAVRLVNTTAIPQYGNRKCGNRYLCWAYMEAANYAVRFNPLIRRWYERKQARKHRVVAIKAVAHKLARACYHMLHEGTSFDPTRAFG